GRAADARWGVGSLQELDHVPLLAPVTKHAATVHATADIPGALREAMRVAHTPHRGPVFLGVPPDVLFDRAAAPLGPWVEPVAPEPDPDEVARAAALLAQAQRPALVAGTDVYWEGAWDELRAAVEHLRVPTFANGLGRGCLPAEHELAF